MDEKIIELGETCAGIKVEMAGMKELLETLTSNQAKLTRLGEKSLYLEQTQARAMKDHDEIFQRLRTMENLRPCARLTALENNQRWLVISVLGAIVIGLVRTFL